LVNHIDWACVGECLITTRSSSGRSIRCYSTDIGSRGTPSAEHAGNRSCGGRLVSYSLTCERSSGGWLSSKRIASYSTSLSCGRSAGAGYFGGRFTSKRSTKSKSTQRGRCNSDRSRVYRPVILSTSPSAIEIPKLVRAHFVKTGREPNHIVVSDAVSVLTSDSLDSDEEVAPENNHINFVCINAWLQSSHDLVDQSQKRPVVCNKDVDVCKVSEPTVEISQNPGPHALNLRGKGSLLLYVDTSNIRPRNGFGEFIDEVFNVIRRNVHVRVDVVAGKIVEDQVDGGLVCGNEVVEVLGHKGRIRWYGFVVRLIDRVVFSEVLIRLQNHTDSPRVNIVTRRELRTVVRRRYFPMSHSRCRNSWVGLPGRVTRG